LRQSTGSRRSRRPSPPRHHRRQSHRHLSLPRYRRRPWRRRPPSHRHLSPPTRRRCPWRRRCLRRPGSPGSLSRVPRRSRPPRQRCLPCRTCSNLQSSPHRKRLPRPPSRCHQTSRCRHMRLRFRSESRSSICSRPLNPNLMSQCPQMTRRGRMSRYCQRSPDPRSSLYSPNGPYHLAASGRSSSVRMHRRRLMRPNRSHGRRRRSHPRPRPPLQPRQHRPPLVRLQRLRSPRPRGPRW
jgi:hypothetical protein